MTSRTSNSLDAGKIRGQKVRAQKLFFTKYSKMHVFFNSVGGPAEGEGG
jgi:hypothetical protein